MPDSLLKDLRCRVDALNDKLDGMRNGMYKLFRLNHLVPLREIIKAGASGDWLTMAPGVRVRMTFNELGRKAVFRTEFEPFSCVPFHYHDADELIIVLEGRIYDGQNKTCNNYVLPAMRPHVIMSGKEGAVLDVVFTYPPNYILNP